MTTADQPNRDALTAALDAYGDAMREFIARVLSAEHGEDPLERFLEPRTHLADVVAAALSDSDRDAFLERIQSGAAVEDAIEVADYPSIVESQWGLFGQHLSDDRGVITRMRRVAEVHAAVEDPLTGDLAESDVAATITEIADLLELIGEHDQANEIRAQLRALAPREAAGSQQDDANGDPETDQRPEDQPTELDPEPAQNAGQEELDEIRLSHMVLRHELTTLESARERLEADIADLKQAQQDTAAHVATQGHIVGEATSSLAELQQASLDPPVGVQSPASGKGGTIVEIPFVGAALFVIVGVILAAVLQGIGIVDLTTLPPQLGASQEPVESSIADLQQAQRDTDARLEQVLAELQRIESSLAELQEASASGGVNERATRTTPTGTPPGSGSTTAPASAGATGLAATTGATELRPAVILNTGPDGMGPDGEAPQYSKCIADQQLLVSSKHWVDGTLANIKEVGTEDCFSWVLVEVNGDESWVREEYVWIYRPNESEDVWGILGSDAERYFTSYDSIVRVAVLVDSAGNKHLLIIEEFTNDEVLHNGTHEPGARGKLLGNFAGRRSFVVGVPPIVSVWGLELGFSWIEINSQGRILEFGDVEPSETKSVSSDGSRVLSARLGWFTERDIELGSYVEIVDLPVHVLLDGAIR